MPPLDQAAQAAPRGASIQARLYAEDPRQGLPAQPGLLTEVRFAADARVETWVETRHAKSRRIYDPLLAKIIVNGATARRRRSSKLQAALDATAIGGHRDQLDYLRADPARLRRFVAGDMTTRLLNASPIVADDDRGPRARHADTVQDWPGRARLLGRRRAAVRADGCAWRSGSPTGCVGNAEGAAGLESRWPARRCGSTRHGHRLAGARHGGDARRRAGPYWQAHRVSRRARCCKLGAIAGAGRARLSRGARRHRRARLLGSRATFTLGGFGGHAGRALRAGDVLHVGAAMRSSRREHAARQSLTPASPTTWEIGVLYGPHGAPDFFTDDDIETFFATDWEVHYNSSRTGVRLIGPKPELGARRRRRGGAASVQHPRQRLRHRRDRLHRRHAGHPGPGRPEPRRLRLPGDDRAGRALEDRASSGPATRPLPRLITPTEAARLALSKRQEIADRGARRRCRRATSPLAARASTLAILGARDRRRRAARGRLSPRRRRLSAGRIRPAWCSISGCASACTRCMQAARAPGACRASSI